MTATAAILVLSPTRHVLDAASSLQLAWGARGTGTKRNCWYWLAVTSLQWHLTDGELLLAFHGLRLAIRKWPIANNQA